MTAVQAAASGADSAASAFLRCCSRRRSCFSARERTVSTLRPLYVPQNAQTWCGRDGLPQFLQDVRTGRVSAKWLARRCFSELGLFFEGNPIMCATAKNCENSQQAFSSIPNVRAFGKRTPSWRRVGVVAIRNRDPSTVEVLPFCSGGRGTKDGASSCPRCSSVVGQHLASSSAFFRQTP